jgi:hypothetical protein
MRPTQPAAADPIRTGAAPPRSVQKGAGGAVEVASAVYEVSGIQTSAGEALFPARSRNSFCYVAVDPLRRVATLWYHAFLPFW